MQQTTTHLDGLWYLHDALFTAEYIFGRHGEDWFVVVRVYRVLLVVVLVVRG